MMNKKEQERFDAAIRQAETLAALRWSAAQAPQRDLPPPASSGYPGYSRDQPEYTQGWDYHATFSPHDPGKVFEAWSSSIHHGDGKAPVAGTSPRVASQQPRHLFSTRALALAAMRFEIESKAATILYGVDKMIQEEAQRQAQASKTPQNEPYVLPHDGTKPDPSLTP